MPSRFRCRVEKKRVENQIYIFVFFSLNYSIYKDKIIILLLAVTKKNDIFFDVGKIQRRFQHQRYYKNKRRERVTTSIF